MNGSVNFPGLALGLYTCPGNNPHGDGVEEFADIVRAKRLANAIAISFTGLRWSIRSSQSGAASEGPCPRPRLALILAMGPR